MVWVGPSCQPPEEPLSERTIMETRIVQISVLLAFMLVACSANAVPNRPSLETSGDRDRHWLSARVHGIIKDRGSSEKEVEAAISSLDGVTGEPPQFWASIADDPRYTKKHRMLCIHQLVKRHVRPGMTLRQMALQLNGATWVNPNEVWHFSIIGGYVPVDGDPNRDDIFSLLTPGNESAIYVSFRGKRLMASDVVLTLQGTQIDPVLADIQILDVWPR